MRTRIFISLFGLVFCSVSCEEYIGIGADDIDGSILGTWHRTDEIPSGSSAADFRYFDIISTYTFNLDATYSNKSDYYGFKDENPTEIIGQSETIGTFNIKGDSIFIISRQNTSWEKGFKPVPETIEYNENIGYGSRFEVVDKTLTLYFISYPADAPVATQMSYKRVD